MDFSRLEFGAPAAERDEALGSYFVSSPAYQRLLGGQSLIVLWNRGAGKSALLKMVAETERKAKNVVIELKPENYSYSILSEVMTAERHGAWAKSGAYAAAWKYMILVLVMKSLATSSRPGARSPKAEKQMLRFLRDNHPDVGDKPLDLLVSYVKRMESIKIGKLDASIKLTELTSLYRLEELDKFMPILVDLCARVRVSVFVDELDQGWDNSEDAQAFVAGVFQACTSINKIAPKRLRVYMSLRQELYENIPALFDDAQKYRDIYEKITWDNDQLRDLLVSRVRHFVPDLKRGTDDQCWRQIFGPPSTFRYMLDRSLHRPRELIEYATSAWDHTKRKRGVPPIGEEGLQFVEVDYAHSRMTDVASEYRFQYADLMSVFEQFRGKQARWRRDELLDKLLDMAVSATRLSDEARSWVDGRDPDQLLEVLWSIGFLKAVVPAPPASNLSESHVTAVVAGKQGTPADPRVNIREAREFTVHPLFISALGMRRPAGKF